jgi:hypothetical protein
MQSPAPDNRRNTYRFHPSVVLEPLMTLIQDGERHRVDTVINISWRGARISFHGKQRPLFTVGDCCVASIQAPGLDGCVDIPARLVFRSNQDTHDVLALVFTSVPAIDDRVDGAFFSVFNRRQDQRRTNRGAVSAFLVPPDATAEDITAIQVAVVNHTSNGMAFIVDRKLANIFLHRDAVTLAIQTPHDSNP